MRRDDHVDALLDRCAEGEYVFPDYGGYCFAGVPGACLDALGARPEGVPTLPEDVFEGVSTSGASGGSSGSPTGVGLDGIEQVAFVFVDGLGYDQWCRAEDGDLETDLLSALSERGTVTPLTSVFPTETAAAVPTANTGQYPVEHGLLGWWQYVDGVGPVQTLPYLTADDEPVQAAHPGAPDPTAELYEADPLYPRVPERVRTTVLEPAAYEGEVEGKFNAGADAYVGYESVPELAVELRRALEAGGPAYHYAYLPQVDASSHATGPDSAETGAHLEAILGSLRRELGRLDPAVADRTLLVVSADHGHVDTGGENVDLRGFDPLWDNLATVDGDPIPPLGSSRQLQVHLREGTVDEVRAALEAEFDCRTFSRPEYEARGLFGPGAPSDTYDRHAPDLVCVHRERGLWYDDDTLAYVGKHGGLTRAEMLVPFAAARASAV